MTKGQELKERVAAQNAAMQAGTTPPKDGERPVSVAGLVTSESSRHSLARMLSSEEMAERWMRIALTECRRIPDLFECTVDSFAGALMICAQLKLEPGPALGLSWILPFNNRVRLSDGSWGTQKEATFVVGYPGVIQLAMRSSQLADIAAHDVCEGDEFAFDYLTGERHHRTPLRGLRGDAYGYYCRIRYANGGEHFLYMTKEQVEAHRDRYSKSATVKKGPWFDSPESFNAMARKTTILQSRRYLPASPDFVLAVSADERRTRGDLERGRLDEEDLLLVSPQSSTDALPEPQEEQERQVNQDGEITKGAESGSLPLELERPLSVKEGK